MSDQPNSCPLPRATAVDLYFMEHRAKVIDIAAFLDRIERAKEDGSPNAQDEFRLKALREAIAFLIDGQGERAKRILNHLSDPTREPLESAGMKGASGAWPGGIPGRDGNPTLQDH